MNEQSFMKALFFGVIAEDAIFPFHELGDSERAELGALLDRVRRFMEEHVDAAAIDRARSIEPRILTSLAELGLFGMGVPKEYGGLGLSATAHARVIQEVARFDASIATLLVAHGAIGARGLVLFGTDEQRRRYLPKLASGESIAAFALTERSSGSDAGGIRTLAGLDEAGRVYHLTGSKPWVTGGDVADLITVFARTSRLDASQKPRIVALLVERGMGVETGSRRDTLGLRGLGVTKLVFDDVRVPVDNVLGEVGKGYKVAMAALSDARLALSASMVGQARAIVEMSVERLAKRRSFGRAIGEFPLQKDKIAKMMADTFAIESMTYLTAGLVDRGVEDTSLETAICRVASAEALWRVVGEAMQVAASSGYVTKYPLERRLRDARAGFVLDATNDILRCFIALAGMQGPGKRLSEVVSAMHEPVKGFGLLREFAVRKVREALRRERLTRAHPLLTREAVMFEETTEALAQAVDRALREHGREIAEVQYTLLRVANIAIDLYALAACVARTTRVIERHGEAGARRQIDLTTMFATAAQARMKAHLERLEHNDDELRKEIAARIYTDKSYPFDVV
jgi:acyl-CoA dehydrogenase family member 9